MWVPSVDVFRTDPSRYCCLFGPVRSTSLHWQEACWRTISFRLRCSAHHKRNRRWIAYRGR